jgi:hypothetical protein
MVMLVLGSGYLLMLVGVVGVLAWVYRHTRLPAGVAYTAWLLASQLLFPYGHKLIIEALIRSGTRLPFDVQIGTVVAALSAITNIAGSGMLIWLLVSLVRWAVPGLPLPWERQRVRNGAALKQE